MGTVKLRLEEINRRHEVEVNNNNLEAEMIYTTMACEGWKIKSFGSSKFLTRSNNSQHFRRTLINSTETGGILPKKAPIRMGWNYKLPALATMAGLIAVDLKCFLDEDSLNEFFGVAWNWGMIATIITLPTAWCLLWVILSATLPAITLP